MNFEGALTRINKIDWDNKPPLESHSYLVSEYLRRASQVLKTCSADPSNYPFLFRMSKLLDKEVDLDIDKLYEDYFPHPRNTNSLNITVCLRYLELAFLIEREEPLAIQFQDLYEPLIKLYYRGGTLRFDKGDLDCGSGIFPLGNWYQRFLSKEPLDISDENLDKIDSGN